MTISPEIATLLILGGVLVGVITGFPVALMVGSVGFIVGYLLLGPSTVEILYNRVWSLALNYTLLAVPLFTFMGIVLESSGISEGLYEAIYLWFGRLRGGLAITTIIFGTILAACVGVITASVTILSLIALPPMIKRGYDKKLATGAVCAAGTLGILIPPSVMLVIYGPMAMISVGKLLMGAVLPGLLLSGLYCTYVLINCFIDPRAGPAVPANEMQFSFREKTMKLLTNMVPPAALILAVLGTIFFGIAPPTEASAIGAVASVLLAVVYRKFSWKLLRFTALETLRVSSFVLLIGCFSFALVGIFVSAGGGDVITNIVTSMPGGRWGAFLAIHFTIFVLGMFMEWIGIVFIMIPIISPIVPLLGFDEIWFALMVCINLQMAFLSPPFAGAIYVCRGTAPPELKITIGDIMRGVIPFILLVMVCLGLCVAFPEIILWLPNKMIR